VQPGIKLVRGFSVQSSVSLLCGTHLCAAVSDLLLCEDKKQPGGEGSHDEEYHTDEKIHFYLL